MTRYINPTSGKAGGAMILSFPRGIDNRDANLPASGRQADFRLRRRPVLTVQIGVNAANHPYGRSRPFALSHDALYKLIAIAERLELAPPSLVHGISPEEAR
jgi:hypothetical protein